MEGMSRRKEMVCRDVCEISIHPGILLRRARERASLSGDRTAPILVDVLTANGRIFLNRTESVRIVGLLPQE